MGGYQMKEIIKSNKVLYYIFHRGKAIIYWIWGFSCEILFSLRQFFMSHFDENCKNIRKLKNSHMGERCFIVATGPSLTFEDLNKLKNEFTISMNSIVNIYDKTDYRPYIYMIQDKTAIEKLGRKIGDDSKVFVGIGNLGHLCGSCITKKDHKKLFKADCTNVYYIDTADSWFYLNFRSSKFSPKFSSDCGVRIYDGCTVTYSAIQLAFYMGFSKVYLLGCDCDYSGPVKHIDGFDNDIVYDKAQQINKMMSKSYGIALDYANRNDLGLYNATRGGKLEALPRVNFDDLF